MKYTILALALLSGAVTAQTNQQYEDECERQMRLALCGPTNDTRTPVFNPAAPPSVVFAWNGHGITRTVIDRPTWAILQVGGPAMCKTVVRPALDTAPDSALAVASRSLYTPK